MFRIGTCSPLDRTWTGTDRDRLVSEGQSALPKTRTEDARPRRTGGPTGEATHQAKPEGETVQHRSEEAYATVVSEEMALASQDVFFPEGSI